MNLTRHKISEPTANIILPKWSKPKQGVLLGFTVSEFMVIVLKIIEIDDMAEIQKIQKCLEIDFLAKSFKSHLNRKLKILGSLTVSGDKRVGDNDLGSLVTNKNDLWINIEYDQEGDQFVFRDLILCGYRYNAVCNLIYYNKDGKNRIFYSDIETLKNDFELIEGEKGDLFFDLSQYAWIKKLAGDENLEEEYGDLKVDWESRDELETALRLLSLRNVILHVWERVFSDDALIKRYAQKEVHGASAPYGGSNKELNFDVDEEGQEEMEMVRDRRDDFDDSVETGDNVEEVDTGIKSFEELEETDDGACECMASMGVLGEEDYSKFKLIQRKPISERFETYMPMRFLFLFNSLQTLLFVALYSMASLATAPITQMSINFNILKQLNFRIKSFKEVVQIFKGLKLKQPKRVSTYLAKLSTIYKNSVGSLLDLILGLAAFCFLLINSELIIEFIRRLSYTLSTDLLRYQLEYLRVKPLGIKIETSSASIIYNTASLIFYLSDKLDSRLMPYSKQIYLLCISFNLLGLSFFLSASLDALGYFSFKIKLAFLFLHWLLKELSSWIYTLFMVILGRIKNKEEDRYQNESYPAVNRMLAFAILPIFFVFFYTLLVFWIWATLILVSSHLVKLLVELLLTLVNHFPAGSFIMKSTKVDVFPCVVDIKYREGDDNSSFYEFDIENGLIFSGWIMRGLSSSLASMSNLASIGKVLKMHKSRDFTWMFAFDTRDETVLTGNGVIEDVKACLEDSKDLFSISDDILVKKD